VAKKLAELLHAAMEIDADRAVRQADASGDFGAGHAFDEAKDERFAIGIRQRTNCLKHLVRFGLIHAGCGMRSFLVAVKLFVEFSGRLRMAVKIHGAIAGDGREPATEARNVAERIEAGKGLEENILDEIFDGSVGDFREENAVDHAGVTGIEQTEGVAIAVLRGLDKRDIGAGRLGGGIHGRETWRMGSQLKVG
jgi:hypothetical protein